MSILQRLKSKKVLLLGVSLLLGAVLVGGCGGNKSGGGKSNALTMGLTNAPDSLNPLFTPGTSADWTLKILYDSLLVEPEANKFEPGLAESFTTTDNQNYTIKLNPKAKWSDGTPVTADDVVFTLNTIANPKVETTKISRILFLEGINEKGKLPEGMTAIPNLKAVDAQTVTFKTKNPIDPVLVKSFIGFEIVIIPKHAFEKVAPEAISTSELVTKPTVTSGPYKFVQYKTNDYLELAANENYYKGKPKIEKLYLRIMNGTNLVTELQAGGVQIAASGGIGVVPIQDVDVLKKNDKLAVAAYPGFQIQYLVPNNTKFNADFRKAISMAINKDRLVKDLYKGNAEVVASIFSSASPYLDKNVKAIGYNPDQAKALLAASGYDTSQPIELSVPIGNVLREQSADLIQQDLTAIGLKVNIQKYDFPTLLAKARAGDLQLFLIGYGYTIDPDNSSYFIPGGSNNNSFTNDPKLTALFAEAASLVSQEDRRAVYNEIQAYITDQQFVTPLYSPYYITVQNKQLTGGIKGFWEGSLYNIYDWSLSGK